MAGLPFLFGYPNATSKAPTLIRVTPTPAISEIFSPNRITANITANTTLSLSMGAT
ncbi:Uncharacterised protein [Yersinia ruckeri]|nr:Uncharacterised protein [Yersinia ruckeri]